MHALKEFLNKFTKLTPPGYREKQAVSGAIEEIIGEKIEAKNINFSNGIAYLKISPVLKNEIALKKEKILQLVKSKPAGAGIQNII